MTRARWRVSVPAATVIAAITLSGCSPANQGAVTLDSDTGLPALVVTLCDGEGIEAVRLSAASTDGDVYDEDETLWRIDATSPQRPTGSIVVGDTPPGFTETQPLERDDLPDEMVLVAENDGGGEGSAAEQGGFFEKDQLTPGVLIADGTEVSRSSIEHNAEINCTSSFFGSLGLPEWLDWVAPGLLATASIAGAALVLAYVRRHRVQPAPGA